MDIKEALQIVFELAEYGADHCAYSEEEDKLYKEALAIFHDMAVNQFGDD
jgi:hypothetical protein